MSSTPVLTFTGKRCLPIFDFRNAKQIPVTLTPGTYASGTLLGLITATAVNDVQTLTITGTPTSSIITLSNLPDNQSLTFVSNVTPAAMATAINALLGPASVGVTGTLNASYVITWGGAFAGRPMPVLTVSAAFVAGTSPAIANVHTTPGIGPLGAYGPYVDANTDGTGVAVGILEYGAFVDANGAIYYGNVTGPISEFGQSELVTPMWYCGDFDLADLVGFDAAALADLQGRMITGTVASGKGVFHFG